MTGPDPAFIAEMDWHNVSRLLFALWLILGSGLGFGVSMLLAHGMLPSLAATRDIPAAAAARARPPLYAAGAAFLGLALFGVLLMVDRLEVISTIYYNGAQ